MIGSSAVSLDVLLGTFMGGMCLGSLLFSRWVSPALQPLRVYALIEIGIAALALDLELLFAMPLVSGLYAAPGGSGLGLRGLLAAVCLLAPTILMGATLPAIARTVPNSPHGPAAVGYRPLIARFFA